MNHKRRVNSVENFQFFFFQDACKAYKIVLINISMITRRTLLKNCVRVNNSDPKAYWSLHKISLEVFAEHFKKLNTVPEENVGVLLQMFQSLARS